MNCTRHLSWLVTSPETSRMVKLLASRILSWFLLLPHHLCQPLWSHQLKITVSSTFTIFILKGDKEIRFWSANATSPPPPEMMCKMYAERFFKNAEVWLIFFFFFPFVFNQLVFLFALHFIGTLQKNLGPASLQYNQGLGGSSLQSQLIFPYPNTVFGTSPMLGNTQTAQNVNSSQLLGSPLVQPR